jgi:hypothetical protein
VRVQVGDCWAIGKPAFSLVGPAVTSVYARLACNDMFASQKLTMVGTFNAQTHYKYQLD